VHESACGTGLPSRDVSFHGEFWLVSGQNAGVLSAAALGPATDIGRIEISQRSTSRCDIVLLVAWA
jgi:hypothetical protein